MEKKLILASASPRRRELLELCPFDFEVMTPGVHEEALTKDAFAKSGGLSFLERGKVVVQALAEGKAEDVVEKYSDALVLGADTIVLRKDEILGKPNSPSEAYAMLRSLCGEVHHVLTGVAILNSQRRIVFVEDTLVEFYPWDDATRSIVEAYVQSGSPMDKAGAYGIQDEGGLLVKGFRGDFFNVVGLPVARVYRELHAIARELSLR